MHDPSFLAPIPALSDAVRPWAKKMGFPVLAEHVHEVLASALFYTFIQVVVSPGLSNRFLPRFYPKNSRAKKANWDIHFVSLIQSVVISLLAIWVMIYDEERKVIGQDWRSRVWAYTGASALLQSIFVGYFVWDLIVTLLYFDIFGIGLLAHALGALVVYCCGYMPLLNYWGPVFILYELSTPFLNIHWFFDKLNLTGSKIQLYNGFMLLTTFFLCRLVWGTYNSLFVYTDIWRAMRVQSLPNASEVAGALGDAVLFSRDITHVPKWVAGANIVSNVMLNALNWHWFFKMVAAVRKRFESAPPPETAGEKVGAGGDRSKGVSTGKARVSTDELRRRRYSIEQVVQEMQPDSDELRNGLIQ